MKSDSDPPSPTPSPTTLDEQAMAVVQDVMRRRRAGEFITDAEVLMAHPELLRPLGDLLSKASAIAWAADEASDAPLLNLLDELDNDSLLDDSPKTAAIAPSKNDQGHSASKRRGEQTSPHPPDEGADSDPADVPRISVDEGAADSSRTWLATPNSHQGAPRTIDEFSDDSSAESSVHDSVRQTIGIQRKSAPAPPLHYRPQQRPPTALLQIRDDNQLDAETYRLRQHATLIGRDRGDVQIPHDLQMSGLHASISREEFQGRYRWILRDLRSRNGVFVRVGMVNLKDGDLLLIANRLVRFADGRPAAACQIQEILTGEFAGTLALEPGQEYWLGRDATQCVDLLSDEPQLEAVHARFACDQFGHWQIFCENSVNGIWVCVREIELTHGAAFQLGEQRFVFELP